MTFGLTKSRNAGWRYAFALSLCAFASLAGCDRVEPSGETSLVAQAHEQPWFEDVTSAIGIDFIHETGHDGEFFMPEIMGGGVAVFDADNNGRLDLYFIQGNRELPEAAITDEPVNRFYRQRSDGTFEDATEGSGLGDGGYGMGVAIGDFDNSGSLDVFVTNFGPDQLYHNDGNGTFKNITAAAHINVPGWSCSAAFVDLNHSGYLDLYITQYLDFDRETRCRDAVGRIGYCHPDAFKPVTDVLLRNNGDQTFTDISESSGITAFAGAGLGVVCDDFNDNGWQDIYVANDGYTNNLWLNQRDETFIDRALIMGVAYNLHGLAEAGMGVIAADLDNTLALDLFMTHWQMESNTFYRNLGSGNGWEDITAGTGLASSSLLRTGFGVAALDTLLRGELDIVIANGRVSFGDRIAGVALSSPWDEIAEPNLFHFNDGGGRFTTLNGSVAAITEPIEISRGLAVGDLNENGQIDIVIANIEGPARVYRNIAPRLGNWITVDAVDPRLNRRAIGARVIVDAGGKRQMRTITAGSSYLSSNDPRAHFGLGSATTIESVEVRWADGKREIFTAFATNQHILLRRGEGDSQ